MRICCIGAGYVGGPSMAVIAEHCPEITINIVDSNKQKIDAWNEESFENLPIYEPGLLEIIKKTRNKNLFFTTNVAEEIKLADIIFICVNTPTKNSGIGAGKASNLMWIERCTRQIAKYSTGETIVVEKSTVPVRTAEVIKKILESQEQYDNPNLKRKFSVLSNPEFLAEGSAIEDLKNPDRILIGGDDERSINDLANIYSKWVEKNKIIKTNLWSSELSKLTSNAFLAQKISSINSISAICEVTGADISEVSRAVGMDKRIGKKFLNAGPGFGGSCFKKDILNLCYLCQYFGLNEVSKYWESVLEINEWQQKRIPKLVIDNLFGNIVDKKIAIWGYAFKANTNDTRESPSILICEKLLEEGSILNIHDPKVTESQIEIDISSKYKSSNLKERQWHFHKNIYESIEGADAILILTEWEEYNNIDWKMVEKIMNNPAWVFDTRSIVNRKNIKETKLKTWYLGLENKNI